MHLLILHFRWVKYHTIDDVKDIYEIIEIIKEAVEENKNNAVFVHNLKFLLLTIDEFISNFENSNEKES